MKLITTSVVRGSHQGESHGGVYLIDLDQQEIHQVIDWNTADIDWRGRGWDRGLRGIAFDAGVVYIAASDELYAYTPQFELIASWRNPYLKHCHEIAVWERTLFLASTGCDSILGFDLDRKEFTWAMHVETEHFRFRWRPYDPRKDEDGPLMLNKLHLNNVHCDTGGLFLAGLKTGGMLIFNGHDVRMSVELPPGTHNARPFRDGVLFNDTEANLLRYSGRDGREDRALAVPKYADEQLQNRDLDQSRIARQGFARGLAVISESLVAGGSSPSTVSLYDLPKNKRVLSVNLTMDVRNAIHGLALWPFG